MRDLQSEWHRKVTACQQIRSVGAQVCGERGQSATEDANVLPTRLPDVVSVRA
ncbi:MAG: hypothetical protein JWP89_6999 [Schlesneria sp.]|nr:hypothetical protein [Schlesneria sp.]